MQDSQMDESPNIDSVINENMELYNLLRKLFYFRLPIGNKLEELVADADFEFWQSIYVVLHKEAAQGIAKSSAQLQLPGSPKAQPKPCPACRGSGWENPNELDANDLVDCAVCKGTGKTSAC